MANEPLEPNSKQSLEFNDLDREEQVYLIRVKQLIRREFSDYGRIPIAPDGFEAIFGVDYYDLVRQLGYYPEAAKQAPEIARELLEETDDYDENADAWVYSIVFSSEESDGFLYIGETLDMERRIRQHIIAGGNTDKLDTYHEIKSIHSIENLHAKRGEPDPHLKQRAKNRERLIHGEYVLKASSGEIEWDIIGGI